jgi:cytidylate kinase
MGLAARLLESVDERQQGWLLETAKALLSAPRKGDWGPLVTESGYVYHLVKTVTALGAHGKCVIVGRGAAFILPAETTLRVCLVGSVPDRIATLCQELSISEGDAARQIRTIDRERSEFVQDHFRKDPTDPRNYDLVINAPRLSVTQSAELIEEALHRLKLV